MTGAIIALVLLSIENTAAKSVNPYTNPLMILSVKIGATTDRKANTGVNSMIDC